MSNFGANNRFLQSNLTTNDLATETTLKDIDQILKSGTINVGVTGVSNINITELNTQPIDIGNGIVDSGTQRITIASDQVAVEVKTGASIFSAVVDVDSLAGQTVDLGDGVAGLGTQRVILATDNPVTDINLDEVGGEAVEQIFGVQAIELFRLGGDDVFIGNGPALSGLGGALRVAIANNNDAVNIRHETIGLQGADATISVNAGVLDAGTQRVTLPTNMANLNNFENWFMRSSQNTGTPEVFTGTISSVATTTFRQMSQGFGDDDFFVNPTGADVDLQISCDSVTHTTQTLQVEAWQQDGTIITSNAVTLNGQLAVNITFPSSDQVYRIRKLLVLTNTMTNGVQTGIGDIVYVSLQGETLTAGVPDDSIMMSMNLGHGIMRFGGQYYVPPNRVFHLLNANFSADSDSNRATRIALQLKDSTATLWFIEFISGVRNSQEFRLPSSNKIEGGTEGMDIRILVSEGDGTGTISNAFTQFHGILE